jgi:hypothetical protein
VAPISSNLREVIDMAVLATLGAATNAVAIGSAALSTLGLTKALVTSKALPKGINGFVFDIPETDNVTLSANISDHFTEENYAIQDHVAFEAPRINLVGRVGELVFYSSYKYAPFDYASTLLDRLTPLGIVTPEMALKQRKNIADAQRAASAMESALKTYKTLTNLFSKEPALNQQQTAFKQLVGLYENRAVVSVETPWKTYENMIIESISVDQDNTTQYESSFTLGFKQLRIVQTKTGTGLLTGRIKEQAAEVVKSGTQKGASIIINTGKIAGQIQ